MMGRKRGRPRKNQMESLRRVTMSRGGYIAVYLGSNWMEWSRHDRELLSQLSDALSALEASQARQRAEALQAAMMLEPDRASSLVCDVLVPHCAFQEGTGTPRDPLSGIERSHPEDPPMTTP